MYSTVLNLLGYRITMFAHIIEYGVISENFGMRHNVYRVTIGVGKTVRLFTFHASHADYQNRIDKLDMKNLQFAFYCYLSDAISGCMPYVEFIHEFGYDKDAKSKKIYEACHEASQTFEELFPDASLNELLEAYQESGYSN